VATVPSPASTAKAPASPALVRDATSATDADSPLAAAVEVPARNELKSTIDFRLDLYVPKFEPFFFKQELILSHELVLPK
jgi:hypothetical protein